MKKLIIIGLLLGASHILCAQNDRSTELKQLFFKAYYSNNIPLWEAGINQLKQSYKESKDPMDLFQIGMAESGLIGACIANKQMSKGEEVADEAEAHLEEVLKKLKENASAHGLYGGIIGFQISFSPMKGMFLGSKSEKHIDKALSLEPENPIAWYQKASSYYHTPSMFGGDMEKALECFEKSVGLFEQNEDLDYNWKYLDALVWLGQTYVQLEQREKAIQTFNRCLKIAPEFTWVNSYLIPLAEKL